MNVLDCILLQCDQKFCFPAFNKRVACKISSRCIDIRDQQGKLTVLECIFESSARQAHGAALKMAGSLRGDLLVSFSDQRRFLCPLFNLIPSDEWGGCEIHTTKPLFRLAHLDFLWRIWPKTHTPNLHFSSLILTFRDTFDPKNALQNLHFAS